MLWRAGHPQLCPMAKTRQKLDLTFVKLTDHTFFCNILTNFEYGEHAMTGNGNYANLLKLAWKNS